MSKYIPVEDRCIHCKHSYERHPLPDNMEDPYPCNVRGCKCKDLELPKSRLEDLFEGLVQIATLFTFVQRIQKNEQSSEI